jgi:hypothetical protein
MPLAFLYLIRERFQGGNIFQIPGPAHPSLEGNQVFEGDDRGFCLFQGDA